MINGPAQRPAATRVGTFTRAWYDQAKNQGWTVTSMPNDWKRFFAFEPRGISKKSTYRMGERGIAQNEGRLAAWIPAPKRFIRPTAAPNGQDQGA